MFDRRMEKVEKKVCNMMPGSERDYRCLHKYNDLFVYTTQVAVLLLFFFLVLSDVLVIRQRAKMEKKA